MAAYVLPAGSKVRGEDGSGGDVVSGGGEGSIDLDSGVSWVGSWVEEVVDVFLGISLHEPPGQLEVVLKLVLVVLLNVYLWGWDRLHQCL